VERPDKIQAWFVIFVERKELPMNLDKLNGFENFCRDVDSYGVSDHMRQVSTKEAFKNASAPEKRAASRDCEAIAAAMKNDAVELKEKLDSAYLPVMNNAASAMGRKLLFTDFSNLSREQEAFREAATPYNKGVEAVTRLYSEGEGYSRQASQLRWSARKDEFIGMIEKAAGTIKTALHLN